MVILVSMRREPQESCFAKALPFKAISFIHCEGGMGSESAGVFEHIEISFTDVQYLVNEHNIKRTLLHSFFLNGGLFMLFTEKTFTSLPKSFQSYFRLERTSSN